MDSRNLLVVEDDPELNELVGAYAEMAGFHYRPALNGTDALAEIEEHIPAAIVLDLMLPDMSGFDVCAKVKGVARTNHVPVIILTALDSDTSRGGVLNVVRRSIDQAVRSRCVDGCHPPPRRGQRPQIMR